MRLNAYLARAGVASRRRADDLIKAGRVRVNGAPGELNTAVGSRDVVEVDGERVRPQKLTYVLLHKPAGVVTTAQDPHGRRTVVDLIDRRPGIVPVGRLDADTTGALLLTNDGQLAHRLAHPRYEVDKVYVAEVEGRPGGGCAAPAGRGRRARGRPQRSGSRPPARAVPRGAHHPRGSQAPGQADARGRRAPGCTPPPLTLRGPDGGRPRPGGVAGAHVRGGRGSPGGRPLTQVASRP